MNVAGEKVSDIPIKTVCTNLELTRLTIYDMHESFQWI